MLQKQNSKDYGRGVQTESILCDERAIADVLTSIVNSIVVLVAVVVVVVALVAVF